MMKKENEMNLLERSFIGGLAVTQFVMRPLEKVSLVLYRILYNHEKFYGRMSKRIEKLGPALQGTFYSNDLSILWKFNQENP